MLALALAGLEGLERVVGGAQVEVIGRVALIDGLGHEEEDQDDEGAVQARADAVRPVPAQVLDDVAGDAAASAHADAQAQTPER